MFFFILSYFTNIFTQNSQRFDNTFDTAIELGVFFHPQAFEQFSSEIDYPLNNYFTLLWFFGAF